VPQEDGDAGLSAGVGGLSGDARRRTEVSERSCRGLSFRQSSRRTVRARVERNVAVVMRDGVTLYADVWRPEGRGQWPILLQRLPYDKAASLSSIYLAGLEPMRAVEAGYAVVIQDTRGRWNSEGTFDPFQFEAQDGVDSIEWAARLPFSTGSVGMYGLSYSGATQLLAATQNPAPLRAIAPQLTAAEFYGEWTYQGGAFQLGFVLYWVLNFLAPAELRRRASEGRDVRALEEELSVLMQDPWSAYEHLPLVDQPVLIELVPSYLDWLSHPDRDAFWRRTAVSDRYGAINVPGLHVGGWYDIFLQGTLDNYVGLRAHALTEHSRSNQRLLVGPWAHGLPYDTLGEVEFGAAASQLSIDMTQLQIDWFDNFLKQQDDVHPGAPVRIFVMGANVWRDEDDWPPPRVRVKTYHLRGAGRANSLDGDGILSEECAESDEQSDAFLFNPRDPIPTVGGATYLPGLFIGRHAGPQDQHAVEQRRDVLVYTGPPLTDDLEVTGCPTLRLYASTSAQDTDFTAKLVDVFPDGMPLGICDGIVRARYRDGFECARLLERDVVYRLEIRLGGTSYVFKKDHRIRLEVSSSNFPRFDRNPNTGGLCAFATEQDLTCAVQRVFHDANHPSSLMIPVA
jgi:putative CocE/NonD family hydrolase